MPEIKVNISNRMITLLDELKKQYGVSSRSQVLETIIEQLLDEPNETADQQEE